MWKFLYLSHIFLSFYLYVALFYSWFEYNWCFCFIQFFFKKKFHILLNKYNFVFILDMLKFCSILFTKRYYWYFYCFCRSSIICYDSNVKKYIIRSIFKTVWTTKKKEFSLIQEMFKISYRVIQQLDNFSLQSL